MKPITETKRKQKNPTTNYAKDTHDKFCKRCFNYNGWCPNTKTQRKDPGCTL